MKPNSTRVSKEVIIFILRAADEIIGQGGRTLLAKILKGSREKKVLQLELDQCPVYGWFRSEKQEEILKKSTG
ncbi:RQC domain-containing protein [Neobacillus sp. LXY-4]|uniref:RQC domain-containing protein n=1 Tax=Neobacillus sp. LXY-4 TaxID=3379826 RepID=UPI003EE20C56